MHIKKNLYFHTFVSPAILFLGIHCKQAVMNMCGKLALLMFGAVLFIIIKITCHLNICQEDID